MLAFLDFCPHAAHKTQELLNKFGWEIFVQHLLYSPSLARRDFNLFIKLKVHLVGKTFSNDEKVM